MSSFLQGSPTKERIPFFINQTDLLAHTPQYLIAPQDGFFDDMFTVDQVGVTTGGTIVAHAVPAVFNTEGGLDQTSFAGVVTGDTLVAGTGSDGAVAGLTITIASAEAAGTTHKASATKGDPSTFVKKGQMIKLVTASFASAGAVNGYITFTDTLNG